MLMENTVLAYERLYGAPEGFPPLGAERAPDRLFPVD
jgi:hypothetical protein